MADLSCNFVGIQSPNPFWLASAPPTDKAYNVHRAFEAGWGGVVWKTLGEDPPIVNVSGPRYAALLSFEQIADFCGLHILEVQRLIRFMPKVVICVVPGWAAGLSTGIGKAIDSQAVS